METLGIKFTSLQEEKEGVIDQSFEQLQSVLCN